MVFRSLEKVHNLQNEMHLFDIGILNFLLRLMNASP